MDCKVCVRLDLERLVLVHCRQEHPFETMLLPNFAKEVVETVIHAQEHFQVPPLGYATLKIRALQKNKQTAEMTNPRYISSLQRVFPCTRKQTLEGI